ncbi:hypothetical protein BJ165DRAFT_1535455 [Panaeolus papilionaceus]|nr:hypothetical protein BJ165DRAFT_1535455 [Panaeolus papilionaceus]
MSTLTQVLPLEIYELIISFVFYDPDSVGIYVSTRLHKRLSLVSKAFASIAQRHLFKEVRSIGFYGDAEKRFKRITGVIEESPHICSYVRSLMIDMRYFEESSLDDTTLSHARTHLTKFFNLQHLDIVSRFLWPSIFQPMDITNPIISLLQHLANTYISQRTLRSLTINDIPGVPISQFLTSPFAERLTIKRTNVFTFDGIHPISRITFLSVHDTPTFILSILSSLPALTHLALENVNPISAASVVNFYKHCASAAGVSAFGKLLILEYQFRDISDIRAFNTVFEDRPHIDQLTLIDKFTQKYDGDWL